MIFSFRDPHALRAEREHALGIGTASVAAIEVLDLPEPLAWCVAQTPEAFAETILRVLDNEELSFTLSQSGFDYLDERFDAARIDRLMEAVVARGTSG